MSIKCPKCGSDNTRNSNVNKFIKGVGEASTSMINALVFQKKSPAAENAIGRLVGGALGVLWHKRVCNTCGHSWWHEVDLNHYDD